MSFVSRWGISAVLHFPLVEHVEDGRTIFPWRRILLTEQQRMLRTL